MEPAGSLGYTMDIFGFERSITAAGFSPVGAKSYNGVCEATVTAPDGQSVNVRHYDSRWVNPGWFALADGDVPTNGPDARSAILGAALVDVG